MYFAYTNSHTIRREKIEKKSTKDGVKEYIFLAMNDLSSDLKKYLVSGDTVCKSIKESKLNELFWKQQQNHSTLAR